MKILLVEDDSFKSDDLSSTIAAEIAGAAIDCVTSVASAVSAVRNRTFDLIILDMALPSHSVVPGGGSPLSLLTGGLEVLFELDSLGRTDPCIIITQYPEIEICGNFYPVTHAATAIQESYQCSVAACLEYSETTTAWRASLQSILRTYANTGT